MFRGEKTLRSGRFAVVLLLVLGVLLSGCAITQETAPEEGEEALPAEKKEHVIHVNHEMGAGTPVAATLERFAEMVEAKSNGRIQVEVYHTGELGSERQMYELMESGAVQMGLSGSALIAAVAPEYGALDMPYLFASQEHLRSVVSGPVGQELTEKILDRKGIRVLGFMDRAPRHLTTKGARVVRQPADLKGLKIRIREIPVQVEAWRALGASPVPMAFGELYTALQMGTVDAQENPVEVTYGNSFQEVQDNLMLTGHVREVQWLLISELFWKEIDEEDRNIITSAARDALTYGDQLTEEQERDYINKLAEAGMNVVELGHDEISAFQEAVKDVPSKFADKWLPGLYERIVESGS
ncbi:MAG: TRAP transporter substrate-binding protein [Bacillota bacterium]|jgi:tripartite ATP-independent transporter DctP family solute receptor